jgi:hypothetical protein
MVSELSKSLLEALKLAPRYLVALGIVAAFLLFGSDTWIKSFGLSEFVQKYRPWLSLIFIGSSVLFAVDRCIAVFAWASGHSAHSKVKKAIIERLNNLTEEEKQILRFYFAKNTKTNVLRLDSGVVQGLAEMGIIYQSANMGDILDGFAHNISDFAWNYLNQHPHLLAGTTNVFVTHKRPDWRI